jgi:hypothetical protein
MPVDRIVTGAYAGRRPPALVQVTVNVPFMLGCGSQM